MNRRNFLVAAVAGSASGTLPGRLGQATDHTLSANFEISRQVEISTPDKAIESSFWIATRLISKMRRLSFQYFGRDGWFAVSGGKEQREHYDSRDSRYGPKLAAYLYGDDPSFAREMGRWIFLHEVDERDGHLTWVWSPGQKASPGLQNASWLGQIAKHFSDYIRYLEQDEFVGENWSRPLKMARWALANFDRNGDGLIENGTDIPNHLWCLNVGEPCNFPRVPNCATDVVVVASMEICELLRITGAYSAQRRLPESDWLNSRADQTHRAIERSAFDPDAGYYYVLYRAPERKWYHSLLGISESSREVDITAYYAAVVNGNTSRAMEVGRYVRKILVDERVFPMPLQYPSYFWISECYRDPYGFVNGGCWEEAYYNCVRLWSHCRMLAPLYEAVRQRSEAYVRVGDLYAERRRSWSSPVRHLGGRTRGCDHRRFIRPRPRKIWLLRNRDPPQFPI